MTLHIEKEGVLPWRSEFGHTMINGSFLSTWAKDNRRQVWGWMTTVDQIEELAIQDGRYSTAEELIEMVMTDPAHSCDGRIFALNCLLTALSEHGYGGTDLHSDVVTTD